MKKFALNRQIFEYEFLLKVTSVTGAFIAAWFSQNKTHVLKKYGPNPGALFKNTNGEIAVLITVPPIKKNRNQYKYLRWLYFI